MELDKKVKEADWVQTHTLTKEQLQKLLDAKLKRAYQMHQQLTKQDMIFYKYR